MVLVKICGITNLADALFAAEAGADALGFNFYRRSPRYIEPEMARSIIEALPASVKAVGVFVNEDSPDRVAHIAKSAGVAAVQLHGDESPAYCRALSGFEVIKALRVGDDFAPEDVALYGTCAVLLDAFSGEARGGTGRRFDWSQALRARGHVERLYLAGGLTADNVAEAIATVGPYAVDACSGVESMPGTKDALRVSAFISAVRASENPSGQDKP